MSKKANDKNVVARLEMVIEYTTLPDSDEVERVIDEGRSYGHVTKATFTTLAQVTKELV